MLFPLRFAAFVCFLQVIYTAPSSTPRSLTALQRLILSKRKPQGTDYIGADTQGQDPVGQDTCGNNGTQPVGTVLQASFTRYGTQDENHSPNCAFGPTADGACGGPIGRGAIGGFTVAVSTNLYCGPKWGKQGAACDQCWELTSGTRSIIVFVNNLCPGDSNPICSMSTLHDTNEKNMNVNFDLCDDSGAREALLGSEVWGTGTAKKLDSCAGRGSSSTAPIIQQFP